MATLFARAGTVLPADNKRNLWAIDVPAATTVEDLERPEFWQHEARKLKLFDRMEIRWEDGQRWADVIVLASGAGFARVAIINMLDLTDAPAAPVAAGEADGDGLVHCYVKFCGAAKWRVLNRKNDAIVRDRIETKAEALAAGAQYDRTVNG